MLQVKEDETGIIHKDPWHHISTSQHSASGLHFHNSMESRALVVQHSEEELFQHFLQMLEPHCFF